MRFEPALQALSDEQLRAKTDEFRQRHANGESLDDLAARGLCGRP
jgi:preprotein translocase subunit SecA